ncbi:hypothetical protein SAMN05216178_6864 [Pseudomonas saponiphila]|uniref:Uncharacterized protein n=2 Tax=Pseudomonas saponiphila TaxID=556534 RepID=A0A1H4ZW57_9PSED|nr:hypothetical protein SAMN05216178_6864 [Pseudomonas saponiphila]
MIQEVIQRLGADIAAGLQPAETDCLAVREQIAASKPMSIAEIYEALSKAGCMDLEIARICGRTLRNVRTLSAVYRQEGIRNLVAEGRVSVSMAYQAIEDSDLTGLSALATLQAGIVMSLKKRAQRTGRAPSGGQGAASILLGEELATLGIPSIGKQDAGEPRAGLHGALSRLAQVLVRAAS